MWSVVRSFRLYNRESVFGHTSQYANYITNKKTRLATADRSCVSIRFTKISAKAGAVDDRIKWTLMYSLITVQSLVALA